MTELEKAAQAYVEELDYIDNQNRRIAGDSFLAGARWAFERAAKEAESVFSVSQLHSDSWEWVYLRDVSELIRRLAGEDK